MFLVVSKENKRKVLRKERKKVTKERNKRNSGIKDYRDKRKIKAVDNLTWPPKFKNKKAKKTALLIKNLTKENFCYKIAAKLLKHRR